MIAPFIRHPQSFDLQAFEQIVGPEPIQRLRELAGSVRSNFQCNGWAPTVWHINSSAIGGGVADILNYLAPLSGQIGITTHWFVIGGDESFFEITKNFHNALQGSGDARIEPEMLGHYQAVNRTNAALLDRLVEAENLAAPDVIVVHDPQPAALIPYLRHKYPKSFVLWRGHIQFDFQSGDAFHPGRRLWDFLLAYINQCDCAIFHLPEMVPEGLKIPIRFILPSINPMAFINRDLNGSDAKPFVDGTLSKYGLTRFHDRAVPLLLQNARFDPWKDPVGVIEAVRGARELLAAQNSLPQLALAGPLAEDDPEAKTILGELRQHLNGDGAVHIIAIDPKKKALSAEQTDALGKIGLDHGELSAEAVMELEINALQTRADIVIAKSLREGFGLAVTGAGYHGKPRIVSQVGGLAHQTAPVNGNHVAALVGGTPNFSRQASIDMTREWIVKLLTAPELANSLGSNAKRHVTENYLPHRHLSDYLQLFLELGTVREAVTQSSATA